jgi:hypothetical protein
LVELIGPVKVGVTRVQRVQGFKKLKRFNERIREPEPVELVEPKKGLATATPERL